AHQAAHGVAAAAHAPGLRGLPVRQIDVLTKLAGGVGLDEKVFGQALRTRKYREGHQRALRHAYEEAGMGGEPVFGMGDRVLTGLQDRVTLEAMIEEELAASKQGSRHDPRRPAPPD